VRLVYPWLRELVAVPDLRYYLENDLRFLEQFR